MPHDRNNITVRSESNVTNEFLSTHDRSNEERLYKKGDRVLADLYYYMGGEIVEGCVIGYTNSNIILFKFNPQEWMGHNGRKVWVEDELADVINREYNGELGFWVVTANMIVGKLDSHKEFM